LSRQFSDQFSQRQGLPNTVTDEGQLSDSDRILWLRPVEDTERRSRLWQQIRSGDRPEAF